MLPGSGETTAYTCMEKAASAGEARSENRLSSLVAYFGLIRMLMPEA